MKHLTLNTIVFLCACAQATTIKSTFQVLVQCPHMLRKPRLDFAPSFSDEVKQVIGTEACKLIRKKHSLEMLLVEYL